MSALPELLIGGPVWLGFGIDSARRLAYHWNSQKRNAWEKGDSRLSYEKTYEGSWDYKNEGERRFGALCIGLAFPPAAYLFAQLGENWDKPPKQIRAAEKRKEQAARIEQLQKENGRLERLLELDA